MMKHLHTIIGVCLLWAIATSSNLYAQITVTPINPVNAVQDVLVGSGVTSTNINAFTTNANSIGYFQNGLQSNIGIDKGIVLTSGFLTSGTTQMGSPASGFMNGQNTGGGSDPDLNNIIPNTLDRAVLQFEFVPAGDSLKFRYVFASEEYPEWVGSPYNDVFAFFLSGPNPAGGNYVNTNVAIIPGTSTPVSINNVNAGSNSAYYISNTGGSNFVFDGYTVVLTAKAAVVPCSTYTIKLAVADVSLNDYDSAVLLEANSFTSNSVTILPDYNYSNAVNDTLIYEGCSDVTLTFVRDGNLSQSDTIPVDISGTAINGLDYTYNGGALPNQVVFLPGQNQVEITLVPVIDGLVEGPETATLSITNITACGDTVVSDVTFLITDIQPMSINAGPDLQLCAGVTISPVPVITGGVPPYLQPHWSFNTQSNVIGTQLVNYLPSEGIYIYSATNGCNLGEAVYDTIVVDIVTPQFQLEADVEDLSCSGTNDGSIDLTVTGPTPPFTYLWTPGNITTQDLDNLPAGTYHIKVTDQGGCVADSNIVVLGPVNIPINLDDKFICSGVPVVLNPAPAAGVSYSWSPGAYFSDDHAPSPGFIGENAGPGTDTVLVHVTATQPGACGTDSFFIYLSPLPEVTLMQPGYDTVSLCPGSGITLENTDDNTGYPPVSLTQWNTGASTATIDLTAPGLYWLELTNSAGCKNRDSVYIEPVGLPTVTMDSVFYQCGTEEIPL